MADDPRDAIQHLLDTTSPITMQPIYSHSVPGITRDGGDYDAGDYDVWDIVFTVEGGPCIYGGLMEQRTMLVRGHGTAPADSYRRRGELIPPRDAAETLESILLDIAGVQAAIDDRSGQAAIDDGANGMDAAFLDWVEETQSFNGTFADGLRARDSFDRLLRLRGEFQRFLGPALYPRYMKAVGYEIEPQP